MNVPSFDPRPTEAQLLKGRRALVTGADSGIGQGIAYELAAHGAAVAINHVGDGATARAMAAEIEGGGGRALPVQMDVAREDDVVRAFGEARDVLGGVDLLVNNAGIESAFDLVDMPLEAFEHVIAVNLIGSFLCAREAARMMLDEDTRGAIVNITSVHEQIPWKRYSHYCASKGGQKLFGRGARTDLDRPLGHGRRRRPGRRVGRVRSGRVRRRLDDLRRRGHGAVRGVRLNFSRQSSVVSCECSAVSEN
jgi:glucose 1-dehydrogenase